MNDSFSSELDIPVLRLDDTVIMPAYAHPGDAGLDLRANISTLLKPFERTLIPCGFSIAIPQGYAGFVLPRSGCAIRNGLTLINSPGLIDSGYRGEVKVAAVNLDPDTAINIDKGDRIAQLVIMPVSTAVIHESHELDDTGRGVGGFGSSGTR